MTLSTAELTEERRRGRIAGAATIAAGVLIGVGVIWDIVTNTDEPGGKNDKAERLLYFHDHSGQLVASSIVRAVGFLLLVVGILHLYRVTKARNPKLQAVSLVIGVFGAIALAVGGVVFAITYASDAADFAGRHFATAKAADKAAEDATSGPLLLIPGTLSLAIWFVIGSLEAMRVGLLTRFVGVFGIMLGLAMIIGFVPLIAFWLVAVGILFLGRWPNGLPPAWESGEAQPWPGREAIEEQPPAEQLESAGGSRNGEVDAVGPGVRRADEDSEPAAQSPSPKRKRKRRR
jgi:uncharacterized protein DUF4386